MNAGYKISNVYIQAELYSVHGVHLQP